MPYDKLFTKNGSFLLGTATAIEKHSSGGEVVLSTGARVKFDVLAVASGSKWEGPLSFPDSVAGAKARIDQSRAKIAAARNIVLVGGGAVGAEFAGEIKDAYPDTKVTVVHGASQLLNKVYPDKFRKTLEQRLRARGVEFAFNEYIDVVPEPGAQDVITRSGKRIAADLVLMTRGAPPNTSFLSSLGADILTETGHVRVKPSLQLPSHPDIFALGDILDVNEQKQAGKVYAHAGVVAANILGMLEGKDAKSIYKGSPELIVITNGKNGGVAYLWGMLFGDWVSRLAKSKTLMVPMMRSSMGLSD